MSAGIWFDRRYVNFLTTASPPLLQPTGVPGTVQRREGACTMDVQCPPYLPDYIKKHGGVDRGDQILSL